MKSISELNEENEKTEILVSPSLPLEDPIEWVDFLSDCGAIDVEIISSGRGGKLLRATRQTSLGYCLLVKCSETKLFGKLYWKWALKGIIDRIEWYDGVINKY